MSEKWFWPLVLATQLLQPVSSFYPSGTVLWAACAIQGAYSCDSCGRECAAACGTRHFRTCCFNYLRKRSGDGPPRALGINYNPRMTRARMDDDSWARGGLSVYRGYMNSDDLPSFADNTDFDVELVKSTNDNSVLDRGTPSQGIRIVNDS